MDLLKFQNDMENETLETAVNTWEKELNQKEKGSGYDLLTQIYGLKEVVCFLEKKYYGKEDELAEQLERSGLKEAHARQVKKIADLLSPAFQWRGTASGLTADSALVFYGL